MCDIYIYHAYTLFLSISGATGYQKPRTVFLEEREDDEDRPRQPRLFSYKRILCFHNKYQVHHILIPSTFTIRNKAELLLCLNNICRHHKNNMTSAPFMNKEQLVRGLDKFTAKNKYAFFDWKELLSHVNDQVNAYTLVSLFSMTKEAELLLELNLCRPLDDEQRQLKVKMKRNSRSMLLAIDHNKKNTSRMKKRRLARCPNQQTSHEHLHISSLILLDNGTPTWMCLARLEGHTGQEIMSTFQQNKRCIIWRPKSKDMWFPMQSCQDIYCCARLHTSAPQPPK